MASKQGENPCQVWYLSIERAKLSAISSDNHKGEGINNLVHRLVVLRQTQINKPKMWNHSDSFLLLLTIKEHDIFSIVHDVSLRTDIYVVYPTYIFVM